MRRGAGAPAGPGIHLPPPLLFVAAVGGGILLNRRFPLPLLPAPLWEAGETAGWVLLAAGVSLACWALATFFGARTSVMPNRPARRLVTGGPYRYSRNPMYVSLTMQAAGVAVLLDTLWPLIFLPAALVILFLVIVRREERYLGRAFGDEYASYRARVRRWL